MGFVLKAEQKFSGKEGVVSVMRDGTCEVRLITQDDVSEEGEATACCMSKGFEVKGCLRGWGTRGDLEQDHV